MASGLKFPLSFGFTTSDGWRDFSVDTLSAFAPLAWSFRFFWGVDKPLRPRAYICMVYIGTGGVLFYFLF